MTFHAERDGGKVVPLEVVTKYIFDNHIHDEVGEPVVDSLPLEKFVLLAAVDLNDEDLIERAAKETHDLGGWPELNHTWDSRIEEVRELYREDVRIVIRALQNVMGEKND